MDNTQNTTNQRTSDSDVQSGNGNNVHTDILDEAPSTVSDVCTSMSHFSIRIYGYTVKCFSSGKLDYFECSHIFGCSAVNYCIINYIIIRITLPTL